MIRQTLFAAALIASLTASPTLAGDNEGHHKPPMNLDYIFDQLKLDEGAQSEVKEVLKTFKKERHSAMKARHESGEGRPSKEEMAIMKQEHHEALRSRLNQVLEEDQVEELVTYMQAHRPHGMHPRKGMHRDQEDGHRDKK